MDTTDRQGKSLFVRQLHRALRYLYDPIEMGKSPLVDILGLRNRLDPPAALRNTLSEAIEALRPGPDVPSQSNAWRIYQILSQRYVEQFTQREVATNLALSTRQLGRLEKEALRLLADSLRSRYALEAPGRESSPQRLRADRLEHDNNGTPSHEQELQWLRASCPSEPVDAVEVIRAALKTTEPLALELGARIRHTLPKDLPQLAVQLTSLRQAILNILTTVIHTAAGGEVIIDIEPHSPEIWVSIRPMTRRRCAAVPAGESYQENLEMARQLVRLSGGSVDVLPGRDAREPFSVRIALPAIEQATVLVIDDNADTLRLLERYLAGSRYRFVGTQDPQLALPLAEEVHPRVIVLDVMLPGIDGWELLARFREHPRLRGVPVLVCTILPQEGLAKSLGATGLVRKPVTQVAFLAALDQQTGHLASGSG